MGLALGAGAHMQELRRTRSGAFGEESAHTLHALQDACVAARGGDRSLLDSMVVSVDAAVPDLPVVVVRDTAIDALCRGAALAGVGWYGAMNSKKISRLRSCPGKTSLSDWAGTRPLVFIFTWCHRACHCHDFGLSSGGHLSPGLDEKGEARKAETGCPKKR